MHSTTQRRFNLAIAAQERGVAFVEFVIIVPILILFLSLCFEFGRIINQYMLLSQIAYEGTRSGIQLVGVPPSCFDNDAITNLGWDEENRNPSDEHYPHYLTQKRVAQLIKKHSQSGFLELSGPTEIDEGVWAEHPKVSSQFIGDSAQLSDDNDLDCLDNLTNDHQNSFGIRIVAGYSGKLIPVSFNITVTSSGPILTNNQVLLNPNADNGNGTYIPQVSGPYIPAPNGSVNLDTNGPTDPEFTL